MTVKLKLLVAFAAGVLALSPSAGGGLWNWSADKSEASSDPRSGYRDARYVGSGNSFRVVRTLNVQP